MTDAREATAAGSSACSHRLVPTPSQVTGTTRLDTRGWRRPQALLDAACIKRNGNMKARAAFTGFLFIVSVGTTMSWTSASAQDTRAYCATAGDDDRLQPLPYTLIPVARRLFAVSSEMPDAYIKTSTAVRCMNKTAWLCNYGANLICDKADLNRKSPGAREFCRRNPDSFGIPMSATGHATIYEWKCVGREARIVRQALRVDARGFIAGNWKAIK